MVVIFASNLWTRARGTKAAADGVDLDELESLHASLDKEAAVGSA